MTNQVVKVVMENQTSDLGGSLGPMQPAIGPGAKQMIRILRFFPVQINVHNMICVNYVLLCSKVSNLAISWEPNFYALPNKRRSPIWLVNFGLPGE